MKLYFLTLLLSIFILSAGGCKQEKYKKVRLKPRQPLVSSSSDTQNKAIRLALAPVISPKSSLLLYTDLIQYLRKKMGSDIVLIQKETYAEVNDLLCHQECDVGFICTGSYIKTSADCPLELLVMPVVDGRAVYFSYIIVHQANKISDFKELRNRSFAFSDRLSLSEHFYVKHRLFKLGEKPDTFFSKFIFTGSHDNSIKSVAAKITAAASVDSIVYDTLVKQNDHYVLQTKVLARSPAFGIPPIVVRSGFPKVTKKKLQKIFLTLDQSQEGRLILSKIGLERFVLPQEENYTSARIILQEIGIVK